MDTSSSIVTLSFVFASNVMCSSSVMRSMSFAVSMNGTFRWNPGFVMVWNLPSRSMIATCCCLTTYPVLMMTSRTMTIRMIVPIMFPPYGKL